VSSVVSKIFKYTLENLESRVEKL